MRNNKDNTNLMNVFFCTIITLQNHDHKTWILFLIIVT